MAQVIVRKLEKSIVAKLKRRAAREGLSMEEKLRRDLRALANEPSKPKMSLKEYLIAPPHWDIDLMDYIPKRDKRHRKVDLSD
jgi:plasmid stability protein